MDKFDDLIVEHGGSPQLWDTDPEEFYKQSSLIPNGDLYDFLLGIREDLINQAKLGIDRLPSSRVGKEVRRRCQTDLMWLARYMTWMTNPASDNGLVPLENNIFDEEFYSPFPKLFVKKDPTKPINQQSEVKTRLLLWPRGGAKSTFDHVDTVQWVLCFPDIRILYLTAEKDLAEGFVGEIKGHFYIKEDPSWMNLFWPEFCVEEGKAGAKREFTCPVYAAKKTGRKEPTVYASSVGKNKAGWRYELIKADDAVSDTNSETSLLCEKISKALFLAEKLLALGGFYIDYIGTSYAEEDHYSVLLSKNIGDITVTKGIGWEFFENRTTNSNILVGKAIQIKPEVAERLRNEGRPITYQEAGEEGCVYLLPKLMSFSWCMADLAKDEKSFEGQRNQNPRTASQVVFDRTTLLRATVPYTMLPRTGPVSQFWDLSFSEKKGTDYCVGSSVMWADEDILSSDGKKTGHKKTVGYVRKIIRDKFNPFSAAQAIVQLVVEERPFVVGLEDAAGSKLLLPTIIAEALKTKDAFVIGVCSNIDLVTPDNQKDAKKIRMGGLLPWLSEGRMKFANFCMTPKYQNLDVLYSEFDKCMGSHHHDDIPDNLGYQPRYAPRATQAIVENDISMFSKVDQMGWNELFNPGSTSNAYYQDENGQLVPWDQPVQPFDDFAPAPQIQSTTPHGMPNILGVGLWG